MAGAISQLHELLWLAIRITFFLGFLITSQHLVDNVCLVLLEYLTLAGAFEIDLLDLVNTVLGSDLPIQMEVLLLIIGYLEVFVLASGYVIICVCKNSFLGFWAPFHLCILETNLEVLFISTFDCLQVYRVVSVF